MLHLNHAIPPFNNPKIAQAALMAINQAALQRAQIVHKELWNTCTSIYPCGSLYASDRKATTFLQWSDFGTALSG